MWNFRYLQARVRNRMFKFFKEKLQGALKKFSNDVEDEAEIEEIEEQAEDVQIQKPSEEVIGTKEPATEKKAPDMDGIEEEPPKEENEKGLESPDKQREQIILDEIKEEDSKDSDKEDNSEKDSTKAPEKEPDNPDEPREMVSPEDVQDAGVDSGKEEIEKEGIEESADKISETSEDDTGESKEKTEQETEEEKKGFFKKIFGKKESSEEEISETEDAEKTDEEEADKPQEAKAQKKEEGFFTKIRKVSLSESKFNDLFWELEIVLLENNVAVEVIEKIRDDLKEALTGEKLMKRSMGDIIAETLHNTIKDILSVEPIDLISEAKKKKETGEPLVIAMIGVNGSGKTTTLAKLAKYFQDNGLTIVVAAADTFRAAAIQQLEEHTNNLGIKLIKHDYNADPAAVAYDAVKHARSKGIDIVLIDSAGRLHSNDNLMNELKKIIRINEPDIKVFVGEATTGNDCVEQARLFDEAVGIDAIILAKADVDEKGGAAVSVSFVTKKPVIFLGTGQSYSDLEKFNPDIILKNLGL